MAGAGMSTTVSPWTYTPAPSIDETSGPALIPFTDDTRADAAAVQAARDFVAQLNANRSTQGITAP